MADPISLKVTLQHSARGSGYEAEWVLRVPLKRNDGCFKLKINPLTFLRSGPMRPEDYGQALSDLLFSNANFRSDFAQGLTLANARQTRLYFQLRVRENAYDLATYFWEMMLHPDTGQPLSCSEDVLFSRMQPVQTTNQPLPPRPHSKLRALVAIASPRSASNPQNRPDFNAQDELAWIQAVLDQRQIPFDLLMTGTQKPCTLSNLRDYVRTNRYDLFYLICHSVVGDNLTQTSLVFEDEASGYALPVTGQVVANALALARGQLRLAVLSTCHSARAYSPDAKTKNQQVAWSLGQELIRNNGVPAVIAMQDAVTFPTMRRMMPIFLDQVLKHGRIERALAAARQEAMEQPDWWMPVLYTNLPNMRLWRDAPHKPNSFVFRTQQIGPRQGGTEAAPAPAGEPLLMPTLPAVIPALGQPKYIFRIKRSNDGRDKKYRAVKPAPQIPSPEGPFVGLDAIFTRVDMALAQCARVILIHGEPGSGRSTLAVQIAARYAAQYPDGSLYYPYPVEDLVKDSPLEPEVEDMLAHLLHSYLPFFPTPDTQAELELRLGRLLGKKRALVVLDDANEADLVAPLIPLLPQGLIVITTLRPLDSAQLQLDPQSLYSIQLGDLSDGEASQVLMNHITGMDARAADYIQREITGRLPLALQLFARLRQSRPDLHLRDIAGPIHDAQDQNGLAPLPAVLAHSLRCLRADQSDALRQLSVFGGAFDRLAAAAVLGRVEPEMAVMGPAAPAAPGLAQVEALLDQLARRGLLQCDGGRYWLHPLVRAEAHQRLHADAQVANEAHARHAEVYLHLLSAASADYLRSPNDGLAAFQCFDRHWREIQRGQRYVAGAGEDEQRRANLCARYRTEGRDILINRLSAGQRSRWMREDLSAATGPVSSLGTVYNGLGALYSASDPQTAENYYTRSIRIRREMRDPREVDEQVNLAQLYRSQGRFPAQIVCYDRCVELLQPAGDQARLADVLYLRGQACLEAGDANQSLQDFDAAERYAQQAGAGGGAERGAEMRPWREMAALLIQARDYRGNKQFGDQARCYTRCIEIVNTLPGEPHLLAQMLYRRGEAYWSGGEANRAAQDFRESERLAQQTNDPQLRCEVSLHLGRCYFDRRTRNEAQRWYRQALQLANATGSAAVRNEAAARLEDIENNRW